jgi:hypothetical protein
MNWLDYLGDIMPKMRDDFIGLEQELPLFTPDEADQCDQKEPCCEKRCTENIEWKRARDTYSTLDTIQKKSVLAGMMYNSLLNNSQDKSRPSYKYHIRYDFHVCKEAFIRAFNIGSHRLRILHCMSLNGDLSWPVHGNTAKKPHNETLPETIDKVKIFVENMIDIYGLPSPGGMKASQEEICLPGSFSKYSIWTDYRQALKDKQTQKNKQEKDNVPEEIISYELFRRYMDEGFPNVSFQSARTDLCDLCDKLQEKLVHERKEEALVEITEALQTHLRRVRIDRNEYKRQIMIANESWVSLNKSTRDTIKSSLSQHPEYRVIEPNNYNIESHYSFDFAQQIHYPYSPQQRGKEYFKTARKCMLFGVTCESISRSVLFFLDEEEYVGKGANTVVSFVNTFFKYHGLGEKKVWLHADNCVGQNKNNILMWYLAWRVMNGLHDEITISFMTTGHTKFSPDSVFGLYKICYRKNKIDSLHEAIQCCNKATNKSEIIPHIYGKHIKKDELTIDFNNWNNFLNKHFKTIPKISEVCAFKFSSGKKGCVDIRYAPDSPWETIRLLKKPRYTFPSNSRPVIITPKGLDIERQTYLYKEIRGFIRNPKRKELTCPKP